MKMDQVWMQILIFDFLDSYINKTKYFFSIYPSHEFKNSIIYHRKYVLRMIFCRNKKRDEKENLGIIMRNKKPCKNFT